MVCLAIWAAYSGRTTVDKIVAVTMPIALFVASGFEHSVANMFMVPLGILISDFAGSGFWASSGLDSAAYGDLTWSSRSEEHTSELQSLMRISSTVFCLRKKKTRPNT